MIGRGGGTFSPGCDVVGIFAFSRMSSLQVPNLIFLWLIISIVCFCASSAQNAKLTGGHTPPIAGDTGIRAHRSKTNQHAFAYLPKLLCLFAYAYTVRFSA